MIASKKFLTLAFILICILSSNSKENKLLELNLAEINIIEVLFDQQFGCGPSSEFLFYVETNLIKKIRGANIINAKVYVLEKVSGRKKLLATENIQVNKFKGAIAIQEHNIERTFKSYLLDNGDKVLGGSEKLTISFNKLIKYESIYNSYLNATDKLLGKQRSI